MDTTTYQELTDKQKKRYNRILATAGDLVYTQGFQKLSLSDLTQKLRISRSTIYESFGSKEGLIKVLADRYNQLMNEGLYEVIADESLSTSEKFLAVADQLAKNVENKNSYVFLRDLKNHMPETYEVYLEGRAKRIQDIYAPLVRRGIDDGLFDDDLEPEFLLQTYLKLTQMVCDTDIIEKSNVSRTRAMQTVVRIFLNGAKDLEA